MKGCKIQFIQNVLFFFFYKILPAFSMKSHSNYKRIGIRVHVFLNCLFVVFDVWSGFFSLKKPTPKTRFNILYFYIFPGKRQRCVQNFASFGQTVRTNKRVFISIQIDKFISKLLRFIVISINHNIIIRTQTWFIVDFYKTGTVTLLIYTVPIGIQVVWNTYLRISVSGLGSGI